MTVEELKALRLGDIVCTNSARKDTENKTFRWKVVGKPRVTQRAGQERVEVTVTNGGHRVNWINHTNCHVFHKLEGEAALDKGYGRMER